jgi:hypothetical protein
MHNMWKICPRLGPWPVLICPIFSDMKFTQTVLDKLLDVLGEAGYSVRFEKGNFQSGFCVLEQKKVVVLNKFLNVEGRITTLTDLIPQLPINFDLLTHESQKLFLQLKSKVAA